MATIRMHGYGSGRVLGASGGNNASTPNSKYDISCHAVTLHRPSVGDCATHFNPGTFTVDFGLSGPAINGRDQSGAFSANSDVHIYFIFNVSTGTLGLIASTAAPPTGPAFPSGYTYWQYVTTVRTDGSGNIRASKLCGNRVRYTARQNVLTNGGATVETAVSVSTWVPAIASEFQMICPYVGGTSTAGGRMQDTVKIRVVSGVDLIQLAEDITGASSTLMLLGVGEYSLPNVGQQFYYLHSPAASTPYLTTDVVGYTVPNGS